MEKSKTKAAATKKIKVPTRFIETNRKIITIQRKHTTTEGSFPIDVCPEIDCFIPDAAIVANRKFDRKADRDNWDFAFLAAMEDILVEKGLRVR